MIINLDGTFFYIYELEDFWVNGIIARWECNLNNSANVSTARTNTIIEIQE